MNIAIIQARMGSSRFPNKTLKNIGGKPLLELIIERIKYTKCIDEIIIATTNEPEDDRLAEWIVNNNLKLYRGSSDDVLDRFYQASQLVNGIETIIRVTADDPFKDPEIIDLVYDRYLLEKADYASNTIVPTYPEGLDIEIFSYKSLKEAWLHAKLPSEREHVTPYIWKNKEKFKIISIENEKDLSFHRWTIDYKEDFEFVEKIFNNLYKKNQIFLMNDILEFLSNNTSIIPRTNKDIIRNEGYLKSIKSENQLKRN